MGIPEIGRWLNSHQKSCIGTMLSSRLRQTSYGMLVANARMFSATAIPSKPKHVYKECPPSERKIRRDEKKKARLQEKEQLRLLDEEAAKSGLEKPWIYRLSLFVFVPKP